MLQDNLIFSMLCSFNFLKHLMKCIPNHELRRLLQMFQYSGGGTRLVSPENHDKFQHATLFFFSCSGDAEFSVFL